MASSAPKHPPLESGHSSDYTAGLDSVAAIITNEPKVFVEPAVLRATVLAPFDQKSLRLFTQMYSAFIPTGKRKGREYRPFSCRLRVKRSYRGDSWTIERVTVLGLIFPSPFDPPDTPVIIRFVEAERYNEIERSKQLRSELIARIESCRSLYELEKIAEHIGAFTL